MVLLEGFEKEFNLPAFSVNGDNRAGCELLRVDENGLALRGVIVRHLVMPGLLEDTGAIVRWLAGELSPDTYVNVMDQYYPAWKAKTEAKFSDINEDALLSCFPAEWIFPSGVGRLAALHPAYTTQK